MTSWSITQWLTRRLLFLICGMWAIAAIVAGIVVSIETNEVFDNALESVANDIASLIDTQPASLSNQETAMIERLALAGERAGYMSYQVQNSAGTIVLRSTNASKLPLPGKHTELGFHNVAGQRILTRKLNVDGFVVKVAEEPEERLEALFGLLLSFLLPLLILLVASFALITRLTATVEASIGNIADQVSQRGQNSLEPIQGNVPEEIKPIVQNINFLMGRLKRALDAERSFAANCAHELRNPIAAARAQAEVASEKLGDNPESARLRQLSQSLTRLGVFVERLLQMNRADAGFALSGLSCDMVQVCQQLMDEYAHRPASANRLDFDDGGLSKMRVKLDQDALAIAVRNLLDNAMAYSAPETEVQLKLGPGPTVTVTNESPALKSEILTRLHERFERGHQGGSGFGLGLAIVQQIIRQSGGSVELKSPVPGRQSGFQALVRLPASDEFDSN